MSDTAKILQYNPNGTALVEFILPSLGNDVNGKPFSDTKTISLPNTSQVDVEQALAHSAEESKVIILEIETKPQAIFNPTTLVKQVITLPELKGV